jgi:hypothetical protein
MSNINTGGLPPGHGGVPPGQGGRGPAPAPAAPQPQVQVQVQVQPQPAGPQASALVPALAAAALPDGFREQAPPAHTGQAQGRLTGNAQAPLQGARELAAPDLHELRTPAEVKERFGADYTAVRRELLHHPAADRREAGARANEFFTQYARQFVQTAAGKPRAEEPPAREDRSRSKLERLALKAQREEQAAQERPVSRDQQQASAREFAESLREHSFDQLVNVKTGRDGVENALHLLTSEDLKSFDQRAANQEIVIVGEFPPPEGDVHDALPPPDLRPTVKKEIGESPADLNSRSASERMQKEGPGGPGGSSLRKQDVEEEEEDRPRTGKRLGRNMLWNALHTLRRSDETLRQEEEKWNRASVAALLFLLFVAIVTVALVSL